jgi:hypothetical protein
LNSSDYTERESISSLLASHDFNPQDEKMKEQLLTSDLCKSLVSKLLDPFIQVRYNSITAILNLIITYSEFDMDKIFLLDAGLLKQIELLLIDYLTNRGVIKYTEGELTKINKLIKSAVDLLLLIIELTDDVNDSNKSYSHLDFNHIIKYVVEIILKPDSLPEDVVINSCLFVANLLSQRIIPLEDNTGNNLKSLAEFAHKIVSDKSAVKSGNPVVISSFICSLFYIYCNLTGQKDLEFVKYLTESIYTNIDFGIGKQIEDLNQGIQNYIKNMTKEDMPVERERSNSVSSSSNSNIKEKMKATEYNIRSTLLYLKTFTDVVNSVELKSNSTSQSNNLSMNEEEEVEIDEEEMPGQINEELEIEKNISNTINLIFQSSNFASLYNMLKNDFMPNLVKFFDNLTIEEFLLNDFDKMIVIKELLYDLEYYTLSLINNLMQNYDGLFENNAQLLADISITIAKRLQLAEYSKNTDFLAVLLTCLRSILEKNKQVFSIVFSSGQNFDFRSLFIIMNNNINDTFIKINVIDIISFIFSNNTFKQEDNLEVCKLLYNICMNENDMEVISHVLNAYFDIYKEDDRESNLILKSVGVVDLMKIGVTEFKTRVRY